jgi:aromatic-L-amino-acid decarboxylase
MTAMAAAAAELVADFVEGLPGAPAVNVDGDGSGSDGSDGATDTATEALVEALLAPPAEGPGEFAELVARFRTAAARAVETAGPSYLAYVGGGGLYTSALAEFMARGVNRFTGLARSPRRWWPWRRAPCAGWAGRSACRRPAAAC